MTPVPHGLPEPTGTGQALPQATVDPRTQIQAGGVTAAPSAISSVSASDSVEKPEHAAAVGQADPCVDPRPRHKRLLGPLATIGVLTLATGYIALVDPNQPGHYPLCPTKALAGLDCPGCGGLRATHDLAHGDIAGAFDNNALWVLAVPVIIVLLLRSVYYAWIGKRPPRMPERQSKYLLIVALAVACFFSVLRNIPGFEFLASG